MINRVSEISVLHLSHTLSASKWLLGHLSQRINLPVHSVIPVQNRTQYLPGSATHGEAVSQERASVKELGASRIWLITRTRSINSKHECCVRNDYFFQVVILHVKMKMQVPVPHYNLGPVAPLVLTVLIQIAPQLDSRTRKIAPQRGL